MYRIGHGDCFLLAFSKKTGVEPLYVLIDCGYKPGSPRHINTTAKEIVDNIHSATGGHLDIAVITHEHQDHVNAITEENFEGITIDELWFAWTEDPEDRLANDLRKKFKDKLLGLIHARNRLAAANDDQQVQRLDDFLAFELGGQNEAFDAATALGLLGAAGQPADSLNKKAMKVWKDKARKDPRFIRPHAKIMSLPGTDVRVYALGPPRNLKRLESLDPIGEEGFHRVGFATTSAGAYFAAAAITSGTENSEAPFASQYCLAWDTTRTDPEFGVFFSRHYGPEQVPAPPTGSAEAPENAEWRRIDKDWLYSAELLALDMNDQTNNSSLVLAFELGKGGKVLLFAADAQRGNWVSWSETDWKDGERKMTAKELLSRTVLYKVGHHGSHNATLSGQAADAYPNLGWMAEGDYAQEFCAMITAVRSWAETQKGWDHPLKAIKDELMKKASGRVFQTDTDFSAMAMAAGASKREWDAFTKRVTEDRLYFDYKIMP